MRTRRIVTNETCNQNCAFCDARRPVERDEVVRGASGRVAAAAARELVLTGGEPTLRRDLSSLVGLAKDARVILETNGALLSMERAAELKLAGLDEARVHLPAWGTELDAITRDPGGFEATLAGMESLHQAGIRLVASAPVVAANRESLPALPEKLVGSGLPFASLRLSVPLRAPTPQALLHPHEAARTIERVAAAASQVGLSTSLAEEASLPPCLFESSSRVAHLFALSPGGAVREGHVRAAACSTCLIADRCPGLPEGIAAQPLAPITQPRAKRRLSVIESRESQIERELWQDDVYRSAEGATLPSRIVRVLFRCNQQCEFCFVSTHLPAAEDEAVRDAIREASAEGKVVVLSGGEPLLHPDLESFARLARAEGAPHVDLQTNAVHLTRSRARELVSAGVDWCFVSLHAPDASLSDAMTGAPGTWNKTALGIDNAVEAGMRVRLNYVFQAANRDRFVDQVELVSRRWPTATLVVSFVAPSTDLVPRTKELIVRYSDVLDELERGLGRAQELGLRVTGFDSMCGVPLCLVPQSAKRFAHLAAAPAQLAGEEMVRAPACGACDLSDRCFGVRRGYAELYGTGELKPVTTG